MLMAILYLPCFSCMTSFAEQSQIIANYLNIYFYVMKTALIEINYFTLVF